MSPAPSPRNVLGLLGAFVVASIVVGAVAAGLAIPAVGAAGVLTNNSVDFFNDLPSDLATPPLSEQSKMLDADGKVISTFFDEYRESVPLEQISPNMQHAIVAIEDARFYKHGGIDLKGLARAAVANKIAHKDAQGASTITQQLVKNELVETAQAAGDTDAKNAARDKTSARKLREIHYAIALEKKMTKPEILNAYLNIAWFGDQVNGVQAASKYYFNTTAAKLTLPQAATLAGMIQSPPTYSPRANPKASRDRRNVVLGKMLDQKMIDQPTHDKAVAAKLGTHLTRVVRGCANAGYKAYFCDYVYQQITENNAFSALGKTQKARENAILRGGLTIKTTMDPKMEKSAWKATTKYISPKNKAATATVSVEPGTGKIKSIQQNKYYLPSPHKTQNTTINYSTDKDYGGSNGFQTGSTFKPFTLATWLKAGKSLNATVNGTPVPTPYHDFTSCGSPVQGGTYTFGNSADGAENGPMTVWNATAASVNGAYVAMEKQLDLCDIRETAEDLGVHLASATPDVCSSKRPTPDTERLPNCVPSLTLGIADISPMTMAAAYAGFASGGTFCSPIAITSITDRNGKAVPIPKANCKQALDKSVANTVNAGLSHVFSAGGTAARVGGLPGRPASGKTGTTNDSVDTWFVGYTPQLATSVWVGDPHTYPGGRKSMNRRTINGHYYPSVFGATIAGPIWKDIMVAAMAGKKVDKFGPPDYKLTRTSKTVVPNVDGFSVSDAMAALKAAGFTSHAANDPVGSNQPAGTVAKTSPAGGSKANTGTEITIYVSSGVPDPTDPTDPGGPAIPGQGNGNGNGGGNNNGGGNGGGGNGGGGPGNG